MELEEGQTLNFVKIISFFRESIIDSNDVNIDKYISGYEQLSSYVIITSALYT